MYKILTGQIELHCQGHVLMFKVMFKGRVNGMHSLIISNHHKENSTCCKTKHNSCQRDCCKDKEQHTNSITNHRDPHQSMPSGDKYSFSSIKQKIYAKCNTFVSLLRMLRIADRKIQTQSQPCLKEQRSHGVSPCYRQSYKMEFYLKRKG